MIDAASSIMSYRTAVQREQVSMSLMKQAIQAEAAMAQLLMDTAQSVTQVTQSAQAGSGGHTIDMYV